MPFPRRLSSRLAVTAALLLFVLFGMQMLFGSYVLGIMQARAKQQLLTPYAVDVAELISQQLASASAFSELQKKLYDRYHGVTEIGIFLFNVDGTFENDLSFSGQDGNTAALVRGIPKQVMLERIEGFLHGVPQLFFPRYIPDPQHPAREIPFAAAEFKLQDKLRGYIVVTPDRGLGRVLGTITWDTTGAIVGGLTIYLSSLGALILGWVAFRSTASRFAALSSGVMRVAEGKFAEPIVVSGGQDELSQLARSVNEMRLALLRRQQERQLILSSVSHDLQTPLSVIAGNASRVLSLSAAAQNGEIQSAAGIIERSARRASAMIGELLELAILDANANTDEAVRTNIGDLVDEVVLGLRVRANEANVQLRTEIAEGNLIALVEAVKIERVLANLLGNAIRHTPEGGSVVAGISSIAGTLNIFVRDSGEGIPHDQLENIFQPYGQGQHTSNRAKGLAGLGLTICREILLLYNSELRVQSIPGKETIFSFQLPSSDRL